MGYNENKAIAGVPTSGPFSIYIYFLDTHHLFYEIN